MRPFHLSPEESGPIHPSIGLATLNDPLFGRVNDGQSGDCSSSSPTPLSLMTRDCAYTTLTYKQTMNHEIQLNIKAMKHLTKGLMNPKMYFTEHHITITLL